MLLYNTIHKEASEARRSLKHTTPADSYRVNAGDITFKFKKKPLHDLNLYRSNLLANVVALDMLTRPYKIILFRKYCRLCDSIQF